MKNITSRKNIFNNRKKGGSYSYTIDIILTFIIILIYYYIMKPKKLKIDNFVFLIGDKSFKFKDLKDLEKKKYKISFNKNLINRINYLIDNSN